MSSIKRELLSVRSVEVYQLDEAKLQEVCEDLNIEKKDSWIKEDMINEPIIEIKSQRSIKEENIESRNEDDFLIEKIGHRKNSKDLIDTKARIPKDLKYEESDYISKLDNNQLFDRLIDDVNGWGWFQKRMWILSLIASISAACNHLSPLYTAYSPEHRCISSNTNNYHPMFPSAEFDTTNDTSYNLTFIAQDNSSYKCSLLNDNSTCNGWAYDSSVFADTIVTKWNLVCDRLALLPTVASSYMAGVAMINGLGGVLSDSIGRRNTILLFSIIHVLFSFLTSISQTYLMYIGVRFFVGGCIHTVWAALFIIAIETVCEPMRTSTGAVFSLGWNVGSLLMTFLAYLLRSWWKLQLAFATFSLLLSLYYFFVPESPRWLLENGRIREAKGVLLTIAKVNKTDIEETQFHAHFEELERRLSKQTELDSNENNKLTSKLKEVRDLFSNVLTNREYLFRLVLMILPWLAVGCSAYGIHFSAKFVNFDMFTVGAIKEFAVFAIILLIVPFFKRGKRVPSVLSIYLISGSLALLFYFIPSGQVVIQVTVFVLCQGFMVGVFYMIGTYTQDVFSTDIRGTTFNFLDCVSKLGTVFAPFIVDLGGENNHGLPPAIFGSMMILSSLTLLFSSETKGLPLTQSYKDMKLNSLTKTSIMGRLYNKYVKSS